MKRYILKIQLLLMVLALGILASCSSEEELTGNTTTTLAAGQIEVGSFPAFGENPGTRSIGTPDAGKTSWADGDVILLKAEVYPNFESNACTGTAESTSTYTLNYNGTAWTLDNPITLNATSYQNGVKFTAYYAPNYEWDANNALVLKDGKAAGTDEYLTTTSQYAYSALSTTTPSISFTAESRNYSRLRVAAAPGMSVTLTATAFTPATATTTLGENTLTATADAKGNAYFYGTWTETASLKITTNVDSRDWTLAEKTITASSIQGKSYALNAIPATYNTIGAGTADSPYRIYNATQLQDLNNGVEQSGDAWESTYTFFQDKYISLEADIDCSGISSFKPIGGFIQNWTPIRFSGTFDGKGHTISNLNLVSSGYLGNYQSGLFGEVKDGTIKNTILKNPKIDIEFTEGGASLMVGALIGWMTSGVVYNCHVIATDSQDSYIKITDINKHPVIGGLIGEVGDNDDTYYKSVIIGCSSSINVQGNTKWYIGGLIGCGNAYKNSLTLAACYATGKITNNNTETVYGNVGGLIGTVLDDALSCYADATFDATTSYVGGIAGCINSFKASYCATTSQLGTVDAGKNGNGATYTGICNDGGTGTPTVTGCFGDIGKGEIYGIITVDGAETQWATIRNDVTTQIPELTGKLLKELWKDNSGVLPTLNISADGTVGAGE